MAFIIVHVKVPENQSDKVHSVYNVDTLPSLLSSGTFCGWKYSSSGLSTVAAIGHEWLLST